MKGTRSADANFETRWPEWEGRARPSPRKIARARRNAKGDGGTMIEDKADPARGARGYHHHSRQPAVDSGQDRSPVKQIAVHVAKEGAGLERLDLALHLAKALDARVVGIGHPSTPRGVRTQPGDAGPAAAITLFSANFARGSRQLDMASEEANDPPEAAEDAFWERARLCSSGVHQWHGVAHGDLAQMIAVAKLVDISLLGQFASKDEPGSPGFFPEDVATASGRPVLVVPNATSPAKIASNIMIAWNGSRGAARALQDAMPLMRDATRITLLQVNSRRSEEDPPADAAASYLEHHGFQAFVESRELTEGHVDDAIMSCAAAVGADLLVAGLSLHSKIHSTLFGSVGHALLRQSRIPILASC